MRCVKSHVEGVCKRTKKNVFLAIACLLCQQASSQTIAIDNTIFQVGPFGQGSTIGVPLTMSGCFKWNNTIRLYLCNSANTTGILIGTFNQNGNFSTFINGRIPTGTPVRTDYYVEARTDLPVTKSNASSSFEIRSVTAPVTFINTTSVNRRLIDSLYYGYCSGAPSTPRNVTLINQSTTGAVSTVQYKDEGTGTITNLALPIGGTADVTLNVTYYTMFTKAEKDGVVSTRYFYLVNPTHNVGLGQSGEQKACLPDPLNIAVDITKSALGIKDNFPGSYYVFDYGDASLNDTLTYCELLALGGIVSHVYTQNSCGKTATVGSQTITNAYPIDIKYINPFKRPGNPNNCDEPVNAAFARIFRKPEANFSSDDKGCVNRPVKFINTTIAGIAQAGNICTPAEAYEWYINGTFISNARDLIYPFSTPGMYTVRLKVENASCASSEKIKTICIETEPVPAFTMNGFNELSGCADLAFNITNLTNTNSCGNTMKWIVYNDKTGAIVDPQSGTYTVTPNDGEAEPRFVFHKTGKYRVELQVSNTCGVYKVNKIVAVTGSAGLSFPKDTGYCNTGIVIDFKTNLYHRPAYFSNLGSETYNWSISGGNFSFENGTTATDAYPTIKFIDNVVYSVTVQISSPCGTGNATQHINFSLPITVDAGPALIENCFSQNIAVSLSGTVTGVVNALKWSSNGSGSFNTDNQPDAIYTLSDNDKKNPNLYLLLKAEAPPGSACGVLTDTIRIKTFANNTGRDTSFSTCTGSSMKFAPVSTIAASNVTYTSTVKTGTITGNTATGAGTINDILINPGNSEAVVEYIITPHYNNCNGQPFTLTVTVYPTPVLNASVSQNPVCNGSDAGIQVNSPLQGAVISWRSFVASGLVTGNTNKVNQAVTTINDKLVNKGTGTAIVVYRIAPVVKGCPGDTVEIKIEILSDGAQAVAGPDQTLCDGTAETRLAATAVVGSGATGGWSLPPGYDAVIVDPSQPETSVNGLKPGKYPLIWTLDDKNCPPSKDTVWVTVLTAIVNVIDNTPLSICPKEPIEIQGMPAVGGAGIYRYQWQQSRDNINYYDIPGEISINLKAKSDTNVFFRRMAYSLQCSNASNPVQITIKPLPDLIVNVDRLSVCPGDEVVFYLISSLDPLLYSYSSMVTAGSVTGNSNGVLLSGHRISDILKTNDSATIAYEFVLFNDGCPGEMETVTIKVLPGVTKANAGTDQKLCETSEAVLKGNVPVRGNGKWLQVSGPATVITDPFSPTTLVSQLQPGAMYSYEWEISASGLACGFSADTVTIFMRRPTTIADAGPDSTTCVPTIDRLPLKGNTPAFNEKGYWMIVNTNMTPIPRLLNPGDERCIVENLSKGYLTLSWTITSDAIDCSPSSDVKTVIVGAPTYIANAGVDQELCNVSNFSLKGNDAPNIPGFWTVLSGTVATIANPFERSVDVTNIKAGTYRFVWTLDNGVCTAARDTVTVTNYSDIDNIVNEKDMIICYGERIRFTGQPLKGGAGNYKIQWQQSIDNITYSDIPGEINPELNIKPLTTTWYRRVVNSPPCSKNSLTVLITVRDPITNNTIGSDQVICNNTTGAELIGSTPIGGNGTYLYQWESSIDNRSWTAISGEIFATHKPGRLTQTTWYRRNVKSSQCPDVPALPSNTVRILVNPDAIAVFNPDPVRGCPPLYINTTVLNAQLYPDRNIGWVWLRDGQVKSNGPLYPADTLFKVFDTTTITLIAVSRYGCKNDTVSYGFATGAPPTLDLGKGDSVVAGTKIKLLPKITNGPIIKYEWTPVNIMSGDMRSPEATINKEVLIGLEVTNSYGCKAYDTVRYKAFCDGSQLYVPTGFSPDRDRINDILMVRGKGATKVKLKIFNRWGQIVFQKPDVRLNEPADGWDGKYNGTVIQDVYTYTLEAQCTAGLPFKKQGNITLILTR